MLEYQGFLILWALFYIADWFTPRGILSQGFRRLRIIAWVFMLAAIVSFTVLITPSVRAGYSVGYDAANPTRG